MNYEETGGFVESPENSPFTNATFRITGTLSAIKGKYKGSGALIVYHKQGIYCFAYQFTVTGNPPNISRRKEADMAIGVLIKRVTGHGEDAKVLLPHIIELRALAVRQPGYISGETFFNLDRPDECLVISRWITIEHWQRWMRDPRRIEQNENLEKHLGTKTEYSIYGIGLW